jgi:hypothetical protein
MGEDRRLGWRREAKAEILAGVERYQHDKH